MTKRESFTAIIDILNTVEDINPELVECMKHEIELLDNKKASPRKPTATQIENQALKADILTFLASQDAPICIKDMQARNPKFMELSNQRIARLLTDLVKANEVERTEIKRVAHFSIM